MIDSFFGGMVVLALLLGGGVFMIQRSMMYPGTMRGAAPAPPPIPGLEQIWLELPEGRVEAWLLPAEGDGTPAPVVLFAHGNGELIDDWPVALGRLPELGVALVLVEYPGYGRSEGAPSEGSITRAMRAAYDAVVARPDVDPERVVLYGRSLGGGAVATLLGERPVAALILQSTFTSAADMAWDLFKVPGFIVRDTYPTRDALERYAGPTLVIHGRHDEIIPYAHGEALQRAAREAELVTYACGHNDCPPSWAEFWHDVERFLREQGVLGAPGDQSSSSS
jgi:hypothetical protein